MMNFSKKGAVTRVGTAPPKTVVWDEDFSLPLLIKFYHNNEISQRENYKYLKFKLIKWVKILDSKRPTGCVGHEEQ